MSTSKTCKFRRGLTAWLFLLTVILRAQGVAVGTRFDVTNALPLNDGTTGQFAQIFVPDYFQAPADGQFTLVFHIHSASWAAEDEVYIAGANAVLFNIHLGGLSSPYQTWFSNQQFFQQIQNLVKSTLYTNGIINNPDLGIKRLVLTSFSAGYAGVREILKRPDYYEQIDALNLADGLHCSSDNASMVVQLADFLRFAQAARDGEKVMLLTHSSIPTSGYQSTTQTANYLIQNIGATREPYSAIDAIGTQYSRCDTGNFHLRGYYGTTATDHLQHLYNMDMMVSQATDILDAELTGIRAEPETPPKNLILQQNFPNPFNASTRIPLALDEARQIQLVLFDLRGFEVTSIFNGWLSPGNHALFFSAGNLPSGEYILRLSAEQKTIAKRITVVK